MSGHVGASTQPGVSEVVVRTAHFLSLSLWVGGLVSMVAILALRRLPADAAWLVLRRFSPVAAAALIATIASGVLMAGANVASITAALTTQYGLALLLKIVVVGMVALLGLRHAVVVARRSRLEPGRLPLRTLSIEAAGALLVVLLGAFLGSSFPAVGAQYDPPSASAPASTQTVDLRDITLRLSVAPNQPGRNLVAVTVINKRRPVPAAVQEVNVVIGDSLTGSRPVLIATADQGGRYDVGSADLTTGTLGLTVWIIRAGVAPIQQTFNWSVPPAQVARHPVVISDAAIAPAANLAAAALIAGGLLIWLRLFVLRAGRPSSSPLEPQGPGRWRVPLPVWRVLARAIPATSIWARH
jgi:hypothetical protein